MHRWEGTLFQCDDEVDGIQTCTQTWTCKLCGEVVKFPHGYEPHSSVICEDKQKLMEAVAEFKKRIPQAWGNGKKAREVKDVSGSQVRQVPKGKNGQAVRPHV
jgi:hypothetical protein